MSSATSSEQGREQQPARAPRRAKSTSRLAERGRSGDRRRLGRAIAVPGLAVRSVGSAAIAVRSRPSSVTQWTATSDLVRLASRGPEPLAGPPERATTTSVARDRSTSSSSRSMPAEDGDRVGLGVDGELRPRDLGPE